jgi:hypothetical protein
LFGTGGSNFVSYGDKNEDLKELKFENSKCGKIFFYIKYTILIYYLLLLLFTIAI